MAKTEVKFFFFPKHKERLGKKPVRVAKGLSQRVEGEGMWGSRVNDSI